MGRFGLENGTSHNSGLALRIFLKFCRMKGANRYMKNLLVVFREKSSFDLFSLQTIFYCLIGHSQVEPGHYQLDR